MKQIVQVAAGIAALLASGTAWASGTYNNHKTDGTNVWIGAASGGSMKDLSNWKAVVGGVEYTDATSVSNLMMKHVTLDIRGLAHGAVLTNDINFGNTWPERSNSGYTMIAGIVYDGQDGDEVSFVKADGCKGLFFTAPSYLDILGGTVVWNGDGGESYPYKKPVKRGAGVFRFASAAGFWESDGTVQLGTLAFTNNVSTHNYVWRVDDGATLKVEAGTSGSRFGSLYTSSSAHSAARLEVDPGATCEIVGGWNTVMAERQKFYGTLAGAGTFSMNCGAVQEFLKSDHVGAIPFTGLLSPWIGDIAFGTAAAPLGVDASASASIPGGGWLRFHADQELSSISGEGVDGGIALDAGQTLTVGGSAATNVFAGRIKGGSLVKAGSSTLALTGAGGWTGATAVSAGTLALGGGLYRSGLVACWNFDNPDDWGADSSNVGQLPVALRTNPAPSFRPYLVEDGVSGKALHFGDGSSLSKGGMFFRANNTPVAAGVFPSGNDAFTFSFWMRPTKGKCGNGSNFIHIAPKEATKPVTNECGNTVYGLSWNSGNFYFGSCQRDEDNPGTSLGAFKNLCFYVQHGWTRDGVWNDGGTSKSTDNSVAYAKFSDGNYLFDGKWHHVVGTYSNRVIRLFVDGVKMDERVRTADINITTEPYINLGNYSTDTAHTYSGDLDEIQWLRGAWSEADVLAEYEARRPRMEKVSLPAPVAHWTFDEKRETGGTYYFDDVTGHGYTLKAAFLATSTMTPDVELQMENVTYPENRGGKAFWIKPGKESHGWDAAMGGHLELADGVDMSDRFPVGSAFTVSLRRWANSRTDFFCFGDPDTPSKNIRLCDDGTPPRMGARVGSDTRRYFATSYLYGIAATAGWVHQTVTYDPSTKVLCLYIDGKRVGRNTGVTVSIDPKQVSVSGNGRTSNAEYAHTTRFDDLRIYDCALDDEQVAALAKVVRFYDGVHSDNELLAAQPNVPGDSDVTVASGATLAIRPGAVGTMKSVSGAGTVCVEGSAWACARSLDWSGFTGTIKGCGLVAALPGTQLDLTHAASVTADVGFADDVIELAPGQTAALAKTPGAVRLPAKGTLRLAGATRAGAWPGKRFLIAECAAYKGPADTTGWAFEPAGDPGSGELRGEFKFASGRLYLQMKGGGTLLLFR